MWVICKGPLPSSTKLKQAPVEKKKKVEVGRKAKEVQRGFLDQKNFSELDSKWVFPFWIWIRNEFGCVFRFGEGGGGRRSWLPKKSGMRRGSRRKVIREAYPVDDRRGLSNCRSEVLEKDDDMMGGR
ncbi:hypothetical protein L6452_22645 [Arctium lappa]|uniref:Uncharacterized protein n=1 Tax=Arctium lappa TaxID=4217 RepID=A0ACB9B1A8_ARCLA|nr:hypothetical protein L6452_22645 [Arctium lappa]